MAIERERRLRFCSSVSSTGSGLLSMASSSRQVSPDQAPRNALDQENGEQAEQIDDRIGEHLTRGGSGVLGFLCVPNPQGERDHQGAGTERNRAVDKRGIAEQPRRGADRDQQQR